MEALSKGLILTSPLYDSLMEKVPKMMIEALAREIKYINLEVDRRHEHNEKHRDVKKVNAVVTMSELRPRPRPMQGSVS